MKTQLDFDSRPLYLVIGLPKSGSTALYQWCLNSQHINTTQRKSTYFWISDSKTNYVLNKNPINNAEEYLSTFQNKEGALFFIEFCPDVIFFMDLFERNVLRFNYRPKLILISREYSSFKRSFTLQIKRSEVRLEDFGFDDLNPSEYNKLLNVQVDIRDSYENIFITKDAQSIIRLLLRIPNQEKLSRINSSFSARNLIRGIIPKRIRKWILSKVSP